MWISSPDAAERDIGDGDRVRVFNDVGSFEAVAKVAPTTQPGQAIIYHAWEPYQFKGRKGPDEPVHSPWKAIHLAGGSGQIHYRSFFYPPTAAFEKGKLTLAFGSGERGDCREGIQETWEVRLDGRDLRLLQHDLGDPHAVGRARMLPGQVMASVFIPPCKQTL